MSTQELVATSDDGTRLSVQVTGQGSPIIFAHEFAGDLRSWDRQIAALSETHTCISYSARGYLPSDVPQESDAYSQERAVDDAMTVLSEAGFNQAHWVGLSMGGYTVANVTSTHPKKVLSATIAGCGWGSDPATREKFVAESQGLAARLRTEGWSTLAETYAHGPTRIQLRQKSPVVWDEFLHSLTQHSALGSAMTMEGVQSVRPSLDDLIPGLAAAGRPLLVITGDEDDGCVEANFRVKQGVPTAAWEVYPKSGHTLNLEEPERFNRSLTTFIDIVEADGWTRRAPSGGFSSTGIES